MIVNHLNFPLLVFLTGVILLCTMLVKVLFERFRVSPVVGYLFLGFGLRCADQPFGYLEEGGSAIFRFLATIGVITLLFRVGLSSELRKLLGQLRRASVVWMCNIIISGLAGYGAAFYLLGLEPVASLIIGAAMTATSVGISVGIWQEQGATVSDPGSLLLDVAELDDISAVIIMGLLFTLLPLLHHRYDSLIGPILSTSAAFGGKLIGFGALCYVIARFTEHPFIEFFRRHEKPPVAMLAVIGMSFIIAALAGLIGFSVAIGAFFAGLVFSRDPEAVHMEASFLPIYAFFSPFFFIGVGLEIDPAAFSGVARMGLVLTGAAFAGKILANAVPTLFFFSPVTALAIGFSMVPRAEIAMYIMQRSLWDNAVSREAFAAMVIVSAATCFIAPLIVQPLLQRRPRR